MQDVGYLDEIPGHHAAANLTLFGHNARIWDCFISDSLLQPVRTVPVVCGEWMVTS